VSRTRSQNRGEGAALRASGDGAALRPVRGLRTWLALALGLGLGLGYPKPNRGLRTDEDEPKGISAKSSCARCARSSAPRSKEILASSSAPSSDGPLLPSPGVRTWCGSGCGCGLRLGLGLGLGLELGLELGLGLGLELGLGLGLGLG
jgi:hypothetical protein